jgi:hypothetical protein
LLLGGLIVSALETALTVTRFGRDWYCARRVTAPEGVIAKTKIEIAMAGRPGDSS